MKHISMYHGLVDDMSRSVRMLDHVEWLPRDKKAVVLTYLKEREFWAIRCALIHDYVANCDTADTIFLFTDGEYEWDSQEIYHFEKYDIALDAQFVRKVLRQTEEKEQKR